MKTSILLFICGGEMTDELRDEFIRLAGPRIVVVTAASDSRETDMPGIVLEEPGGMEALKRATAVWFKGGDQDKLMKAYGGTEVENCFWTVPVIGGTSAGAAVMSPIMLPNLNRGFGFLPGTIVDQHFTERDRRPRLIRAVRRYPDYLGLGIDEGTALIVGSCGWRVMGKGKVHQYVGR